MPIEDNILAAISKVEIAPDSIAPDQVIIVGKGDSEIDHAIDKALSEGNPNVSLLRWEDRP
jgi:hypothetical protein